MSMNPNKVIIPCRFSYLHCWEPDSVNGGDPRYSVSAIIPKSDTWTVEKIRAAIENAKKESLSKWGGKIPPNLKLPLRDGDIERPDDEAYADSWFLNANSRQAPQVVDRKVQRILDQSEVYSMHQIAQKLMAEKRPSAYVNNWDASHVHCILTNEKYVGDVLMQKKYTVDHLTHREVKNRDHVLPSYYVRDHHTPIVSRKQYDRVHRIAELKSTHKRPVQYPYGDLLVCPVCGERLMQHKMDVQDTRAAWHCDRNESSCGQYVLKPRILDAAMLEAYRLVDVEQVKQKQSEAAQIMAAMKQKHPSFKTVEYFWLDDLVEKITFGRNHAMTVHWKYGGKTDVTLQIANMKDDPVYVAGLSRRKRERGEAQNALLEKASDLMASDMPQEEVMAALAREAKKYARRAAAF